MSCLIFTIIFALITYTQAVTHNIYPKTTNWQTILSNLNAGDVAIIHYGIYTTAGSGFFQLTLNGNINNPIIIKAASNQERPIIQGPTTGINAQNVLNIQGSNFLIQGIGFTKGARGVRVGPAVTTNAVFDNIHIFNTTGASFSVNDAGNSYVNITLRNSEMENPNAAAATTGECVYAGCVNDLCRIRNSLIEHNYCHDTLGSSGGSRAGFQVKSGSHNVVIRNNVCYNVLGPCIIVYDDYDRGRNIIDGNLAINAGAADLGIQCTSGATITNNIVINSNLAGIGVIVNSLYSVVNQIRNITISHNTVYASRADACLRLNSVTNRNISIANNVLFCGSQPSIKASHDLTGALIISNAINGAISATGIASNGTFPILITAFQNVTRNDFYPTPLSPLINKGVNPSGRLYYDYNGRLRSPINPTIGAYEYSTVINSGFLVAAEFKGGSANASMPKYQLIQ